MATWALIVNGVVQETTTIDPAGRYAPTLNWVSAPNGTTTGQLYSNGSFSAAPASVSITDPALDVTITNSGDYPIPAGFGVLHIWVNKTVSEPTNIIFPAPNNSKRTVFIKDGKGDAASNNITLVGAIDNNGNYVMDQNKQGVQLYDNGSWMVI